MRKKCDCNLKCDKTGGKGKKSFFWLIPIAFLAITVFGLFGPKKMKKSTFGKGFLKTIGLIWGLIVIACVWLTKRALKNYARKK